ncbi:TetR/AcrR family transcriptional regulator [Frankia sp. CNm7]|uniref:TetR/AcrR family transcriptional regulator n=1 Tax=Frankia nepalensis TaxID=1836974 RepID=A0A937UT52_9ACTN|nr:TetR/AcrR family transcriptional regulator [Frankia nepalensis]MBL7498703.1 TetR/AcrR family transcriptional regulator [Frankia nepalensis]MBL7512925.1 TetR/AcrR family transcriptional regulator [Frankia nepalensis]MBL7521659.1 TetR/AcrR family transcriptional regulator [Frankia nepalensis]MBL7633212.1 TetR/AcrR family transcriptional regulator [Frankia nepalensis]
MEADRPAVSSLAEADLPAYQAARRQRIIDAARTLLEEQEYEQIQIRDVAATAKFALGTVYRYFSSKEHLYAVVLRTWGSDFDRTSIRHQDEDDPMRRLEQRMRSVLAAFERRPHFFRALILLQSSTDPNAVAHLAQFRDSVDDLVEADLAKLDPDGAAEYSVIVWAVLVNLLTRSIFHNMPMGEAYQINARMAELLHFRFEHGKP